MGRDTHYNLQDMAQRLDSFRQGPGFSTPTTRRGGRPRCI